MNQHHVIYVPGIGDNRTYGQDIAIQLWRLYGLYPHYIALGWGSQETYASKLTRLLSKIDQLKSQYPYVSLVGVSAGASAVLNAYARSDKVCAVVCLCGKINNPQSMSPEIFQLNPSFQESMIMLPQSLSLLDDSRRSRIMSIHPLEDPRVPIEDTIIRGSIERTIPTIGHTKSIAYGILFDGQNIAKFLHQRESQQ